MVNENMVCISDKNTKMGHIPSVSLSRSCSCDHNAPCYQKGCYYEKLEKFRTNTAKALERNSRILRENPENFWKQVSARISISRSWRWSVAGDIPNEDYFIKMIQQAEENPECKFFGFTKKYNIVNNYLRKAGAKEYGDVIPENFHLLFSPWEGFEMSNPYNFPVAKVVGKKEFDNMEQPPEGNYKCHGFCEHCMTNDEGCFAVKAGEAILLKKH